MTSEERGRYAALLLQRALNDQLPGLEIQVGSSRRTDGMQLTAKVSVSVGYFVSDQVHEDALPEMTREYSAVTRLRLIERLKTLKPTLGEIGIYGSSIWQRMYECRWKDRLASPQPLGHSTPITDKDWQR